MTELPAVLRTALAGLPPEVAQQFIAHLRDGTSCEYLSDWLTRLGAPVSATTLKRARARLTSE